MGGEIQHADLHADFEPPRAFFGILRRETCSHLRTRQPYFLLGPEDIAVEIGDPLPTA
jgi:hypothetical protein